MDHVNDIDNVGDVYDYVNEVDKDIDDDDDVNDVYDYVNDVYDVDVLILMMMFMMF